MRRLALVVLVALGLALAGGCTNRPTEPNKDKIPPGRLKGVDDKQKGPTAGKKAGPGAID